MTVGGTVSGLQGAGLTLQLNGGPPLLVAANGTFVFPAAMTTGSAYAVTVSNQPSTEREVCSVSNASGTIGQAAVTDISVGCSIVAGFLYSAAGPNNQILTFGISAGTGTLLPTGAPVATGSDPLNMVTARGGQFLYAGNLASNSISAYAVDAGTGALTSIGPAMPLTVSPYQMVMSASGFLFVYGQIPGPVPGVPLNPPEATLSGYAVNAVSGALSPAGTALTFDGNTAVRLAATPDGKFLYVLTADDTGVVGPSPATVTAYGINGATGQLTAGPAISPDNISVTMAIDRLGRFLYLTSDQTIPWQAAPTVLPYTIDSNTGALTPAGTGVAVASNAGALAADRSGRYLYFLNTLISRRPMTACKPWPLIRRPVRLRRLERRCRSMASHMPSSVIRPDSLSTSLASASIPPRSTCGSIRSAPTRRRPVNCCRTSPAGSRYRSSRRAGHRVRRWPSSTEFGAQYDARCHSYLGRSVSYRRLNIAGALVLL